MHFDPITLIKAIGTFGLLAMVFAESGLFFGFFLPGDSLLFSAGLLASAGYLNLWILLILVPVAAILGDNVGFWFGKKVGPRIFFKENSFFFNKKYIDQTKAFYEKHGKKTIILARFVPFVRTFAPILAGVGEMEYKTFLRYNVFGGIFWVLLLTSGGYLLGKTVPGADKYLLPIVIAIVLTSLLPGLIEIIRNYFKKNVTRI